MNLQFYKNFLPAIFWNNDQDASVDHGSRRILAGHIQIITRIPDFLLSSGQEMALGRRTMTWILPVWCWENVFQHLFKSQENIFQHLFQPQI